MTFWGQYFVSNNIDVIDTNTNLDVVKDKPIGKVLCSRTRRKKKIDTFSHQLELIRVAPIVYLELAQNPPLIKHFVMILHILMFAFDLHMHTFIL